MNLENLKSDVEKVFVKLQETKNKKHGYREHATLVDTLKTSYRMILEELPSEEYRHVKKKPINRDYSFDILTTQSIDYLDGFNSKVLKEVQETEKFKTNLLNSEDYKGYHKTLESYKRLQDLYKDINNAINRYKDCRKSIGTEFVK